MIALESIPRIAPSRAAELAAREFGVRGTFAPLPSERDQNFLIEGAQGRFVLKIANREDTAEILEFQHGALERVGRCLRGCAVQAPLAARSGAPWAVLESATGERHFVRLMRWIEGSVLGERRPRGAALLESIGAVMGQVDVALAGYSHPAMQRVLQWDLKHADLARAHLGHLVGAQRERIEAIFAAWSAIDWSMLPHGVIHGDANDYNVLIDGERMVGLLDFGDMVHSALVCELAIASAYGIMHEPDVLAALAALVRGYHRARPLEPCEQRELPALVLARLAASVCFAALARARAPSDTYQSISERAAWASIGALERHSARDLQRCVVRACA